MYLLKRLARLLFDLCATSKNALLAERRSRYPLEPVLGAFPVLDSASYR
jgi:hypothetical protein